MSHLLVVFVFQETGTWETHSLLFFISLLPLDPLLLFLLLFLLLLLLPKPHLLLPSHPRLLLLHLLLVGLTAKLPIQPQLPLQPQLEVVRKVSELGEVGDLAEQFGFRGQPWQYVYLVFSLFSVQCSVQSKM